MYEDPIDLYTVHVREENHVYIDKNSKWANTNLIEYWPNKGVKFVGFSIHS